MKRQIAASRWWILAALVALALAALALGWPFGLRRDVPEYNIVLITFDTTRADRLGCYGAASARTPNIDTLAGQGIRYANCYSPGPITLPSHTSLMTGLYPFRHGLRDNNAGRLADDAVTLPEVLKQAGYQTGAVVAAYVLDSRFGLEQGFDSYNDDLDPTQRDSKFHIAERKADAVSTAALAWLDSVQDSKFFLWAHYFDPHANYTPPGVDPSQLTDKQLYELEIAYADQQMGRLLKRIGEIQQSTGRPTLMIVTSDHGESLGGHGEPTHGMFVYGETIRIPLVIFDSTARDRGIVIEEPVSLVDVMPSILERLGMTPPYEIDGRRLPKVNIERSPDEDRLIYFETIMPYNYYRWSPLEGAIQGDDKLIVAPKPEFFDLKTDPGESRNLYEDGLPRAESLWTALEELKRRPLDYPTLAIEEAPQDSDAIAKLATLGYVGKVGASDEIPDDLPDPKAMIILHRELMAAQSLAVSGNPERAFDKLRWIIFQDPDNKTCLNRIADLIATAEPSFPPDDAIKLLQQLTKMRPESSEHALALGKVYLEADQIDRAITTFDQAVQLDDLNVDALNHYAWFSYEQNEHLELAGERAQRAVDLEPRDPHVRHTLACIMLKQDRPTEAVAHLEIALELNPKFAAAHYHLGVAKEALGDAAAAAASLEKSVELAREVEPDWLPDAEQRIQRLNQTTIHRSGPPDQDQKIKSC